MNKKSGTEMKPSLAFFHKMWNTENLFRIFASKFFQNQNGSFDNIETLKKIFIKKKNP